MSGAQLFYVFELVGGDECLVADRPDFADAVSALRREAVQHPGTNLSIWGSRTMGIVAMTDEHGVLELTPRGESLGLSLVSS